MSLELTITDEPTTISAAHAMTARHAAWEAESILRHLNKHLAMEPDDSWMRSFVVRLHALNSVTLSVLDGDNRDLCEMQKVVEGIAA